MNIIPAWVWFLSGLLFLVAEMLTPTFFFGIVGVGALVASLVDFIGGNEIISLIAFILASVGSGYLARRYEIYSSTGTELKSGTDRLIDQKGIVEERIDPSNGTGIVKVEGEKWRAKSKYDNVIEKDSEVIVESIEGATLIVWEVQTARSERTRKEV